MITQYNPNHYLRYQEMMELLQGWAEEFPQFTHLQSLGQSREGREIWMMTLTDQNTGTHDTKPGYWVSGNIHASEFSGCQASVHVIFKILAGLEDKVDSFIDLIRNNSVYVVPKISPDGAEFVMDGYYVRSSNSLYPHFSQPSFRQQDMDGDGQVRSLLIPSRAGIWKKSKKDGRILLPRKPNENKSNEVYYHLYSEGRPDPEGGGESWNQIEHGLDYNRNFPTGWRPEGLQVGAGKTPLSNPETAAVAKAILDRPNIIGAQDFHTYSAVILRPSFQVSDKDMDPMDLRVLKEIGEIGEELTGYPCLSVAEDFCYDRMDSTTGGFIDWMYQSLGIYAYTNEIWSLFKNAGVKLDRSGHMEFLLRPQTEEVLLKIFKWCDENAEDGFFKPWEKLDHPDFGEVEVGGWSRLSPISNPPSHLLEKEVEGNADFVIACIESNPRLELVKKECITLNEQTQTKAIILEIENTGYLGTKGANAPGLEGTVQQPFAKITLAEGQKLLQGKIHQDLPHLTGRSSAGQPFKSSLLDPAFKSLEINSHKQTLQWTVQGPGETQIEIHYPRGRTIRCQAPFG